MGGARKWACSPCLAGLFKAKPRNRRLSVDKVATIEDALKIGREQEGTWRPSPKAALPAPAEAWTTPVPRPQPTAARAGGAVEMQMIIEDLDSDAHKNQPRGRKEPGREQEGAKKPASGHKHSKYEIEQLIQSPGTLPKPMLPDQRESAIRTLQPTATYEMLAQVPHEFLEASTPEAQELRRKLVCGATVVFTCAGYPGKRFIFERAAALGVKSVIVDHPDSWSRHLVAEGIIAKFLPVDMSQSSDEVFKQAEALIRELGKDGLTGPADGITTFVELSVPLAARLCEAFGLPGMRPAAVDAARDKHCTRAALKAAGLPTPRNMLVRQEAELRAAGEYVGFPAVLKPVSGAASLGVKKVTSMEDLEACYRDVRAELSSLVVSSGALVKGDSVDTGVDASAVVDLTVLLEQYLDGKEVDVDLVMSDGQWRYAAVSDNGPTAEPWFNETWGLCPSLLPKHEQDALKELAWKSVAALGFSAGIFHVECKYTSTGPQLIEVNARMGGGPVRELNRLVWGVDLVEEALFCALGVPARPTVPKLPNTCVGYSFVNAPRSGRLRNTDYVEGIRKVEGVLSADPLVKAGDHVVGTSDGIATWLCQLVVQGPTPEKTLEKVLKLEAELPVQID